MRACVRVTRVRARVLAGIGEYIAYVRAVARFLVVVVAAERLRFIERCLEGTAGCCFSCCCTLYIV